MLVLNINYLFAYNIFILSTYLWLIDYVKRATKFTL